MNWTRSILDGLAMAAYFNLFAAAAALCKPRLMFPCYPPAIIKAAKEPPTKREATGYWRDTWFLVPGVDGLHPVDDGQHRRSVFS